MEQPYNIEIQQNGGNLRLVAKKKTNPDIEIWEEAKSDDRVYPVVKEKTMENCQKLIGSLTENLHIHLDDQFARNLEKIKIKAPKNPYLMIKFVDMPSIDKVIFNPPATIVMWDDGTKTVVKVSGESFSEEVGLCEAIAKRYFGSR